MGKIFKGKDIDKGLAFPCCLSVNKWAKMLAWTWESGTLCSSRQFGQGHFEMQKFALADNVLHCGCCGRSIFIHVRSLEYCESSRSYPVSIFGDRHGNLVTIVYQFLLLTSLFVTNPLRNDLISVYSCSGLGWSLECCPYKLKICTDLPLSWELCYSIKYKHPTYPAY